MKYLPLDVSSFSTMINGNYRYIDKTSHIYNLFNAGGRYYFLSRPRRFGKSLLVSTLKELFTGNKELFKDLWIETSDYIWKYHPVIHLDFCAIAHATPEELSINLAWTIDMAAREYNIDTQQAPGVGAKLIQLITQLSKKYGPNSVVILIDEYDKPMLDHLRTVEAAEQQRDVLKNFYDVLKGVDCHLRAIFITGVSKFSKTSLFSGINNLNDISLDPVAAQLLGYTQEEIETYFADDICKIATQKEVSSQELLQQLKTWYNGYRFSRQDTRVYNPFSILYFFEKKEFENYWFESGTPSFLMHLIQKDLFTLDHLQEEELSIISLGAFDLKNIPLIPLLFQTGYVTITDYNIKNNSFKLGFPNEEVGESFNKFIFVALTQSPLSNVEIAVSQIRKALNKKDIDAFCTILQSLLANIPGRLHIKQERYYHSLFLMLCNLVGKKTDSEVETDRGRIDLVLEVQQYVYIFELKFNESADVAFTQIEDRKYYQKYYIKNKTIVLVGLSFTRSEQEGLLINWKSKEIRKQL